ncbi:MAG: hypothetical protein CL780_03800 [Chloroflexi bacterium]|nr:hypothetical protein [Chloroflexota bacterium]
MGIKLKLHKYNNILVIFNDTHSNSSVIADKIFNDFSKGYNFNKINEFDLENYELKSTDLVVTIGGDGTILRAAHKISGSSIPILGINTGRVGFMSELESNNFQTQVQNYFNGGARIEYRFMLEAKIKSNNTLHALNDITLARGKFLRVIEISTEINGVHLATYRGDGVVASSPTGSTAYSLSLGSPVLDPTSNNILLKPIATHMSQFGGVVLGSNSKIKLTVFTQNDAILNIDGFMDIEMGNTDSVEVKISNRKVGFLRMKSPDEYWGNLSRKLGIRKGTYKI